MAETQAKLNNLRIAPRKVRLVADLIKGMSAAEARAELTFSKKRSAPAILKLLQSAVANAKNNQKLEEDKLYIKSIRVDKCPRNKRRFKAVPIYIPRKKKDRKKNKRRKKGNSERKTGETETFGRRKKRRSNHKKGRGTSQKVFPA